jgi:uroporphyrinogen-III synthase
MSRPLLVLRPEPGASATAARVRAMGREAVVAPLFTVGAVPWEMPSEPPQALLLTSANAVRQGGAGLVALTGLPVYAVGAATAEAARAAGFMAIVSGEADAAAIVARAARDGVTHLLHLAGRAHRAVVHPGLTVDRRIVYAAEPVAALPEAARAVLPGAVALLHSPRAAALFARLADPSDVMIAAISPAALAAAGPGWRAGVAAPLPTDASLLAVAAGLCDQGR